MCNNQHIKISCLNSALTKKEALKFSELIETRGSSLRYGESEFSVFVQDEK